MTRGQCGLCASICFSCFSRFVHPLTAGRSAPPDSTSSTQPSEPHLTAFLTANKHLSDDVVNDQVYPVSTYAYLPALILAAPFAEVVGYKWSILLASLCSLGTRTLLLFGEGTGMMQWMQVLYSLGMVSETLIVSYVFRVVGRDSYPRVVAASQVAFFISQTLSGVLGDVMTQALGFPLVSTFWVSFAAVALASFVCFMFLPDDLLPSKRSPLIERDVPALRLRDKLLLLLRSFRDKSFLACCVLWVSGNCLWSFIFGWEVSIYELWQPNHGDAWNGSVLAGALSLSALASAAVGTPSVARFLGRFPFASLCVTTSLSAVIGIGLALSGWPWGLVCLMGYMAVWPFANTHFNSLVGKRVSDMMREDLPEEVEDASLRDASGPYSLVLLSVTATSLVLQSLLQLWWLTDLAVAVNTLYLLSSLAVFPFVALACGLRCAPRLF
jgi:hypothetical protein